MGGLHDHENKDGENNLNRTKTLIAALALAIPVPAVIAGCGGDDESSEDPQEVVEGAFNNDTKIESGVIDLTVDLSAEGSAGGSLEANISGPFAMDADDPTGIGTLDLDITASGDGAAAEALGDFEAGITVTEDNVFVNYNGTDYELGEDAYAQIKEQQAALAPEDTESSTFREQCETAIEDAGGDKAACDIDVTAWFSELTNEGTEDVGGAEATHVAGALDVEQMVTDLFHLGSSIPGATGDVDPSLIEPQLAVISDAVSGADFDVYAATEDGTLRGLDFSLDLDTAALGAAAAGIESASLGFSLEISEVGEEQTIEAPADAQPIEDLAGELGGLGLIPGGGEIPEIDGGGSSVDPDCISDAAGNPDEIQKCLE
ncbi:MAG: hypothetical protein QOI31_431 [Solirubrobacterales bacterium]|nr:hypothetical protein [Solirubrobacterales bacterium]